MLTSRILRPGLDLEALTLQRPRRSRLKAAPSSPAARDTRTSKGIWKSQSLLYITDRLLSKDSMPVYPLQPQHGISYLHLPLSLAVLPLGLIVLPLGSTVLPPGLTVLLLGLTVLPLGFMVLLLDLTVLPIEMTFLPLGFDGPAAGFDGLATTAESCRWV